MTEESKNNINKKATKRDISTINEEMKAEIQRLQSVGLYDKIFYPSETYIKLFMELCNIFIHAKRIQEFQIEFREDYACHVTTEVFLKKWRMAKVDGEPAHYWLQTIKRRWRNYVIRSMAKKRSEIDRICNSILKVGVVTSNSRHLRVKRLQSYAKKKNS